MMMRRQALGHRRDADAHKGLFALRGGLGNEIAFARSPHWGDLFRLFDPTTHRVPSRAASSPSCVASRSRTELPKQAEFRRDVTDTLLLKLAIFPCFGPHAHGPRDRIGVTVRLTPRMAAVFLRQDCPSRGPSPLTSVNDRHYSRRSDSPRFVKPVRSGLFIDTQLDVTRPIGLRSVAPIPVFLFVLKSRTGSKSLAATATRRISICARRRVAFVTSAPCCGRSACPSSCRF